MLVQQLGHEVRTAYDGPNTLANAIAYRPNVVLLDIDLPVMNGYELARLIQGAGFTEHHTGRRDRVWAGERPSGASGGLHHHLLKPADFTQVEQILATVAEDNSTWRNR